jgi:DNA ligase-1
MELVDLFDAIKATASLTEKIRLLKNYPEAEILQEVLSYTYNEKFVFGITGSSVGKQKFTGPNPSFPFNLFHKVLEAKGRNQKISTITDTFLGYTAKVQEYFLRALDKDLGIGIKAKTINKAFPGLIEEFDLMLAERQDEDKYNREFAGQKDLLWNVKIDGIRCICEVSDEGAIVFFSRDGKVLQEFLTDNIKRTIEKHIGQLKGCKLDGELYSSDFQKLMKIVQRKEVDLDSIYIRNGIQFTVFDVLRAHGKDTTALPLRDRLVHLNELISFDERYIRKLQYFTVDNNYSLVVKLAKYFINKGHEGIMVKNPDAPYVYKRSPAWMKFKRIETIDLKIIGYEPGEAGTKYENCLGALILDYDGKELRCGSGFTDKDREELWKTKDDIVGKIAEIQYMEKTKTKSLRHPVFLGIRFDKHEGDKE